MVSGIQFGNERLNIIKISMTAVATRARTQPPINAQATEGGNAPENKSHEVIAARDSRIQASSVRRKRVDPRAAERLTPQLIRAR